MICAHGYVPDFIGYAVARLLGLPLIAVARGYTARDRKVRFYERVDRRILRKFDHVVAVSDALRGELESWGVRPERLSTIHNAIPPIELAARSEARARLGLPADALLIGCVGRLSPEKGHALLLQAMAELAQAGLNATVVICGDGPERGNLEARRRALGIADRVVLTGYVAGIESLLSAFDIFALPSYSEGLPRALLEASAAGIPAVASAVGGIPELIRSEETGLLVPAGDAEALAQALSRLIENPSIAARIGRRAQHRVMAAFSVAAQLEQYQTLFLEIHSRWEERRAGRRS
jgi:glycosyltransferase involved in cell wall biosynthesis